MWLKGRIDLIVKHRFQKAIDYLDSVIRIFLPYIYLLKTKFYSLFLKLKKNHQMANQYHNQQPHSQTAQTLNFRMIHKSIYRLFQSSLIVLVLYLLFAQPGFNINHLFLKVIIAFIFQQIIIVNSLEFISMISIGLYLANSALFIPILTVVNKLEHPIRTCRLIG